MNSSDVTTEPSAATDTTTRILDVAEELVQTRGFNAVSYAHIAVRLNISKPSLHYHFPTKAMLGEALIRRYSARFFDQLDLIGREVDDAAGKLERYVGLYRIALAAGRLGLCGILVAEYNTVPDGMKVALREFFDRNEAWLADVLAQLDPTGYPQQRRDAARSIIGMLEGSLMLASAYDDIARFDATTAQLLSSIASSGRG